jgi:hypothetical protein
MVGFHSKFNGLHVLREMTLQGQRTVLTIDTQTLGQINHAVFVFTLAVWGSSLMMRLV